VRPGNPRSDQPANGSRPPSAIPCNTITVVVAQPEQTVDQRALVERAIGGDHDAFAALLDARLARVDAAARLILRDPELARDAVQDGVLRAWRDLSALRDPDRFDAWLHRLVVRSCLDHIRRRRSRVIEVELTTLEVPQPRDVASDLADRELVDRALAALDPGHRAVVALHYLLGMPLPDVAASMGIPLGTAKSRLHRALQTMRVEAAATDRAAGEVVGGHVA
jgi:RNA polymerase sigma-70 factor (ECF subfamily)